MIAITGATGQLGRKVVASLVTKVPPSDIVAIVRDPAKAEGLGVAVRQADYSDPNALEQAFAGIDKLLLISSNDVFGGRTAHHLNAIEAARKAGVKHIVYTSLLHADRTDIALAKDHQETEAALRASGVTYTFLRNGWYWENNTPSLGQSLEHGAIVGGASEGRISWASRQDFAEAAAAVLAGSGHEGQIYELAGDTGHTMAELAAEASRQSGKPLEYRNLGQEEYAKFLENVGLPAAFANLLAEVDVRAVATGLLEDDSRTLSKLIGRPTTPLSASVEDGLRG
jgi:NAD(P)H dehydrogenase (quinone)